MISNNSSLLTNAVKDILDTVFSEELVSFTEGDLDDTSKLGELTSSIILDIADCGEVGYELLGDMLPS